MFSWNIDAIGKYEGVQSREVKNCQVDVETALIVGGYLLCLSARLTDVDVSCDWMSI